MFTSLLPLISIGALVGIWWGTGPHALSVLVLVIFTVCGIFLVSICKNDRLRVVGVMFLAIALGAVWGGRVVDEDLRARLTWGQYAGDALLMSGTVNFQEKRGDSIRYRVGNIVANDTVILPGQVEFWIPFSEPIQKGSHVSIRGKVVIPEEQEEVGTFRPAEYYARYDVYALMRNPSLVVLEESKKITRVWGGIRSWFHGHLVRSIPEPSAGLMAAILLGDRGGIPSEMREEFTTAGVAHLIAISGLHVGLLTAGVFYLCGILGFSRIISSLLAIGVAVMFIAFAGFPPSGMRALIMIIVFLLAYATSRRVHATRALVFAAALMAMVEPRIVRADVGFQLSVAAMWGITAWYPIIRSFVSNRIVPRNVTTIVCVTTSAMLITAPIIAYAFGRVSIVGLVVNVIVAPIFPLIMIGGVAVLILGSVPFLGSGVIAAAHMLSFFLLWIISRASSISGSALEVQIYSPGILIIVYTALFLLPIMYVSEIRAQFIPDKILPES